MLKEERVSHLLPIRSQGQLYYCYNSPEYDSASGRAVYFDMIIKQSDGSYHYGGEGLDFDNCSTGFVTMPRPLLYIWEYQPDGLVINEDLQLRWVSVDENGTTQWVPQIAYFDPDSSEIGQYVKLSEAQDKDPEL